MRKYPINHKAFSKLTSECVYWIGFLMADGCVEQTGRVRITLKSGDIDHLRKFLKFVGSGDRPIYRAGPTCNQIAIDSRQIAKDLIRRGVIPLKNWNRTVPSKQVARMSSFWLGLLDGDGSITTHRSSRKSSPTPQVSFCGNKALMKMAMRMLSKFGGSPTFYKTGSIFSVIRTGRFAQKALKWMYSKSPVYLDRKHVRFVDAMEWRPFANNKRKMRFVYFDCVQCGKQVKRQEASVRSRGSLRKACTLRCWYKFRGQNCISTKPSLPAVTKNCRWCRKEFRVWGCVADTRHCCTNKCARRFRKLDVHQVSRLLDLQGDGQQDRDLPRRQA